MTVEALIFDVDGTLADTEETHRQAFELAFLRFELGWSWSRELYGDLLRVSGGKERIEHYIATLPLPQTERARLRQLVLESFGDPDRPLGIESQRRIGAPMLGVAQIERLHGLGVCRT